ncbi:uncharacterized protein LOC143905657 isoform X1 [Temnothorax americanus]|uniref:uncharacterized protein LOC143905657 isoform X1 n=1 Tax=Temnothorax americanus TaxID=1964332 RepID=UPI004069658A
MECIKKQDEEKKKLVKDFLKLLVVDIGTSVNRTVFETQSAHKRHKKVNLPSLEDIKKLHSYLVKRRTEAYAALKEFFTYEKWISLAEVTLTAIHVFNRRRAGEIERAYIEDFENYEKVNKNMYSDIYKSLSVEDRRIAEKYVRFCIRGKLGRTVPVLLSNDLLDCIILILKYRQEAKVPKKNPYIFGLPSINKNRYRYLRACILMRKFARDCNASQSTTLRGTTLRKHIATHCLQLNLNDIDVSDLANFMGHADKIHREHYRQPQASRDILKISQYLEAVQGDEQDASNDSASDNESEKENNSRDKININTSDEADMPLSNTQNDSKICQNQVDKQGGKRKRSTSPYGKTKRLRWTDDEKEAVLQAFAQNMANHTLPSLKEIQETRKNYPCLANRTSPQIKTWLHNKQKSLPKL